MEHILELAKARRSVRSFDEHPLREEHRAALTAFWQTLDNPWGIPVVFRFLDAKAEKLSAPVITGTDCYLGGKVARVPHAEETFGYTMEALLLFARSLGIGSTWIGGTMDRAAFERAMELGPDEFMPCVTPLGYPAAKMSLRETMMRKAVRADSREPFEALFFNGDFDTPLSAEKAGSLREPLECVRLAPSAVNRQPWRVLVGADSVHFYKKGSKGYISAATGDLQKVDLGIALCHFDLSARECGLSPRLVVSDPPLPCPEGLEYIASFELSK